MRFERPCNGTEWYALCREGSTEPLSIFYLSREQAETALEGRKHDDLGMYVVKVRWRSQHQARRS